MKKSWEVFISVVVKLDASQKGVDAGATQRRGSVVFIVFVSIVVTSKGESSVVHFYRSHQQPDTANNQFNGDKTRTG